MSELEILRGWWVQLAGAVAFVIWLIRLEAAVKANASELRRVWRQREEDQTAARDARETTNRLLDEMRGDIKTLLARRD